MFIYADEESETHTATKGRAKPEHSSSGSSYFWIQSVETHPGDYAGQSP